jgi:hypothetical protein
VTGLHIQQADAPGTLAAGQPGSPIDGHHGAGGADAQAPGEERLEQGSAGRIETEFEDAVVFEKELAFLREEQGETGEIDLLIVDLGVGEVRVVGQIEGQVAAEPPFDVQAGVLAVVVDFSVGCVKGL